MNISSGGLRELQYVLKEELLLSKLLLIQEVSEFTKALFIPAPTLEISIENSESSERSVISLIEMQNKVNWKEHIGLPVLFSPWEGEQESLDSFTDTVHSIKTCIESEAPAPWKSDRMAVKYEQNREVREEKAAADDEPD